MKENTRIIRWLTGCSGLSRPLVRRIILPYLRSLCTLFPLQTPPNSVPLMHKMLLMSKLTSPSSGGFYRLLLISLWISLSAGEGHALAIHQQGKQFYDLGGVRRSEKTAKIKIPHTKSFFSLSGHARNHARRKTKLALRNMKMNRGNSTDSSSVTEGSGKAKLFIWPVDASAQQWVSSPFGQRKDPFTGKPAFHAGVDIAAAKGTYVLASADGRVDSTGIHPRLGKFIRLVHDEETYSLYGHLSQWDVREGETVKAGHPIGRVGSTGRSTGAHLDFSIRKGGKPVNPLDHMSLPDTHRKQKGQKQKEQKRTKKLELSSLR